MAGRTYDTLTTDINGEQHRFQQLFLNDDVHFSNGWPVATAAGSQTWVVPRTAWTPKYGHPGWQGDENDGVYDILIKLLRDEPPDDLLKEHDPHNTLDRLNHTFASQDGTAWCALTTRQRLMTRSALTPIESRHSSAQAGRGTTMEGQLYSFSALETGQPFVATITGPTDLLDTLIDTCCQPDTVLTIGQGRSRGMGQVAIERIDEEVLSTPRNAETLTQAIHTFTDRIAPDGEWAYLPITLLSDVIMRDRYLHPCSSGDPIHTLAHYWTDAPPQMQLKTAIQQTYWTGGWDAIRQMPREPQLAIQQGSVWVYQIPREEARAAVQWWLRVAQAGLGERRNIGFGQVYLLHPMHQEERIW